MLAEKTNRITNVVSCRDYDLTRAPAEEEAVPWCSEEPATTQHSAGTFHTILRQPRSNVGKKKKETNFYNYNY